jgi:dimethylargininase
MLAQYRPIEWITGDGRLEGGDVLRVGRTLYVGLSRRTNAEGITQLRAALGTYGYEVVPVPVPGCLHLKTGATAIDSRTLLANPDWVDTRSFAGWDILPVPPGEDFAANVLVVGDAVLVPSGFHRTEGLLRGRGHPIRVVDMSELQKAEAGVTCCSIVFSASPSSDKIMPATC